MGHCRQPLIPGTHPPEVVRLATVIEGSYTTRRGNIRGVDLAKKKAER